MKLRLLLTAFLIVLAMPVRAEPGPIGIWLMNEPASLWDWGMKRAREEAQHAAEAASRLTQIDGWWEGTAWYSWENNEIEIRVDVTGLDEASHDTCNKVRREFIGWLALTALNDEQKARVKIHDMIGGWFSHEGYSMNNRDERLAEKLTRIIFVNARLWNSDPKILIECRARITTFSAPSEPRG